MRGISKVPAYAWHCTCRVLLEDIIDNLARDGEHYATCSLSFAIGESEPLFGRSSLQPYAHTPATPYAQRLQPHEHVPAALELKPATIFNTRPFPDRLREHLQLETSAPPAGGAEGQGEPATKQPRRE